MILKTTPTVRARLIGGVAIFLLAFGVRILTWHDTRLEVGKIQTSVVGDYQRVANLIRDGGIRSFFSSTSALADLNNLGHPPGYSILVGGIYSIAGPSSSAVQMCQITADALCAVLLFLIVSELLPLSAGVLAGLLAALSPQLAWNSVLLLPDSISVLPVLLAVYALARALRNPRLLSFIIVGALIGLSCWLRANFMLLSLFGAAAVLLLVTNKRWQFALAVICGTLLIVLPLTIRNAIVFHRFIPLSLGAGQTFLEGIADYDKQGRFSIPSTDVGIMKQEAEIYQRPDYYGTLFNPDGVERERARLTRGVAVVRSHPIWFAGVMAKRASSMVRLERSRLISTEPAITHSTDDLDDRNGTVTSPQQLLSSAVTVPGADLVINTPPEPGTVLLEGNKEAYGPQLLAPEMPVKSDTDYLVTIPVWISVGRMRVSVVNASGNIYSSQIIEPLGSPMDEWRRLNPSKYRELSDFESDQPEQLVKLPFVAVRDERVRVVWSNEASNEKPLVKIGVIALHQLGVAKYVWTRYPRLVIHAIQKVFITALVLPFAIIGLVILIWRRSTRPLVILSAVPIYFFLVQSIIHTEYRYVLAVAYFLFAFAGVTIGCGMNLLINRLGTRLTRSSSVTESAPSA